MTKTTLFKAVQKQEKPQEYTVHGISVAAFPLRDLRNDATPETNTARMIAKSRLRQVFKTVK